MTNKPLFQIRNVGRMWRVLCDGRVVAFACTYGRAQQRASELSRNQIVHPIHPQH